MRKRGEGKKNEEGPETRAKPKRRGMQNDFAPCSGDDRRTEKAESTFSVANALSFQEPDGKVKFVAACNELPDKSLISRRHYRSLSGSPRISTEAAAARNSSSSRRS